MLSFDQAQEALTNLADELPAAIYRELNGGIILLPDTKIHPQSVKGDLYILGEYHCEPRGFGRYITIYFGSFLKAHGHLSDKLAVQKLGEILRHELVHHLENLAGDRTLEVRDEMDLARYKQRHAKQNRNTKDKSP